MKRENYLKPQTARELLAMEQGICAGSIFQSAKNEVVATKHDTGFDGVYDSGIDNSDFEIGGWY